MYLKCAALTLLWQALREWQGLGQEMEVKEGTGIPETEWYRNTGEEDNGLVSFIFVMLQKFGGSHTDYTGL